MRILVGCPVLHREWVMPAWFEHVENAFAEIPDATPEYIFVGDRHQDPDTFAVVQDQGVRFRWVNVLETRPLDVREWNQPRYERMAELRNVLLGHVRELAPDLFLSLDSDILLHPRALADMLELVDDSTAVGGKVYLSQYGVECPSWANISREGSIRRTDSSGTFRVDVIMAVKLMPPAAYRVDYRSDVQGEDIGWSKAAREQGVKLMWTGRSASKHLFSRFLCAECGVGLYQGRCVRDPDHRGQREALTVLDKRVGW